MIISEVAVVRNEPSILSSDHDVHPKSGWLVVSNRASWLELFKKYILSFKEHERQLVPSGQVVYRVEGVLVVLVVHPFRPLL